MEYFPSKSIKHKERSKIYQSRMSDNRPPYLSVLSCFSHSANVSRPHWLLYTELSEKCTLDVHGSQWGEFHIPYSVHSCKRSTVPSSHIPTVFTSHVHLFTVFKVCKCAVETKRFSILLSFFESRDHTFFNIHVAFFDQSNAGWSATIDSSLFMSNITYIMDQSSSSSSVVGYTHFDSSVAIVVLHLLWHWFCKIVLITETQPLVVHNRHGPNISNQFLIFPVFWPILAPCCLWLQNG